MLFSPVKISSFCKKAHLVFHWCLYNKLISFLPFVAVAVVNRELKMETFSGRRRPDWQRKPGTKAAVASRQKQNIKIAVSPEGRRL